MQWSLVLGPLRLQKQRLATVVIALMLLAAAQGAFLILVGPFLKTLFLLGGTSADIALSDVVPKNAAAFVPNLSNYAIPKSTLVFWLPVLLLICVAVRSVAKYLYSLNQESVALFVAKTFRNSLFSALLGQPYAKISQKSSGKWMSMIMNDVLFLQTRFSDIFATFLHDSVLIISCFAALAFIHWPTALVLLVASPFVALGLGRVGKRISFYAHRWQTELARLSALVLDLRARFDFIRAQGGERVEIARFERVNDEYYGNIRKSLFIRSTFAPALEFGGFMVFAAFVYIISRKLWGPDISPDLMMQFFAALGLLLRPLKNLGEQLGRFHETKGSLTESLKVMGVTPLLSPSKNLGGRWQAASLPDSGFRLNRLSAGYEGKQFFECENLDLMPGKAVVFIGPSGAGKSTFMKTIAGLYEPLVWDASVPWEELKSYVSLVSQEPFLFDDSLRINLLYGQPDLKVSEDRIKHVLDQVNILNESLALKGGLDAQINSISSNVSGGQLQRLVIARALLRNKPILLFDEATSAVDPKTERDITQRMIAACRENGQILLSISHRLQCLEFFDEVYFIEAGKIALRGRHQDLLSNVRYRKFIQI
jgi:subfamily B ATP-binding cassette protein MsbA